MTPSWLLRPVDPKDAAARRSTASVSAARRSTASASTAPTKVSMSHPESSV